MKKILILVLIFLLSSSFINILRINYLDEEQKNKVRQVAKAYIEGLSKYSSSPLNIPSAPITDLFSAKDTRVFNDLDDSQPISIADYCTMYIDNFPKIENITNISSEPVIGLAQPNMAESKKEVYGQILVKKKIVKNNKILVVNNYLTVDLKNYKIFGISQIDANPSNKIENTNNKEQKPVEVKRTNPFDFLIIGLVQYNKKDYKTAFDSFKVAAQYGIPDAQYYLGVMYILNKGCEINNRKERDKLGIYWLKLAGRKIPQANEDLNRLGIY